MLLTPATPPPHVGSPSTTHASRGHGSGTRSAAGAYPNVVITSDMLKAHKIKLARKPTPAPAPPNEHVFSTISTH
jgi:hypothetical protein